MNRSSGQLLEEVSFLEQEAFTSSWHPRCSCVQGFEAVLITPAPPDTHRAAYSDHRDRGKLENERGLTAEKPLRNQHAAGSVCTKVLWQNNC